MTIVIVSDIFGKTPALEKLCSDLPGRVIIVDPYKGKYLQFKDESEAYSYFSKHVGLDCYSKILENEVELVSDNLILVGFSIGASAIWEISDKKIKNVSSAGS